MDNPDPSPLGDSAPRLTFVPDRRYTALAGAGLVVAVIAIALADVAAGRLVAVVAAVVLAAYVVGDLVFSPRLVADAGGLTIRTPTTRTQLPWHLVAAVRADTQLRHGLRSTTLEIDADEVLVVLSRRALGADPDEAAGLINAFRPA